MTAVQERRDVLSGAVTSVMRLYTVGLERGNQLRLLDGRLNLHIPFARLVLGGHHTEYAPHIENVHVGMTHTSPNDLFASDPNPYSEDEPLGSPAYMASRAAGALTCNLVPEELRA